MKRHSYAELAKALKVRKQRVGGLLVNALLAFYVKALDAHDEYYAQELLTWLLERNPLPPHDMQLLKERIAEYREP